MNILNEIAEKRKARLRREGRAEGAAVPHRRKAPLVPFGGAEGRGTSFPFLICEVKRKSPSAGELAVGREATAQAKRYVEDGIRNISVLTEKEHFAGSLADLVEIKSRFPRLSLLRKDFLLDDEDIDVSFRAGADAVLLIASLLDGDTLASLYRRARSLGMAALVEIHDEADIRKAMPVAPSLTGINSRDLTTFKVDLAHPIKLRNRIDWPTRLVFESGIAAAEHVVLARSAGFDGILVGESVMKQPALTAELVSALESPLGRRSFWRRLFQREGVPLIKVCGLTRAEDARLAADLGADILGFIFAPSKRRADPRLLRELPDTSALKVGVVATDMGPARAVLDPAVAKLLADGLLDAVQFHGDESPEGCYSLGFPYYKAIRVGSEDDVARIGRYRCPRVLIDAWSQKALGGTGERIAPGLLTEAAESHPLWMAGGIGPDNVGQIIDTYGPELIDSSSGLERSPGIKDRALMVRYFGEIRKAGGRKR
jgi:indole-3-glycerol phosphate synthase/phosphoribosylanthranilate isomerase